MERFDVAEDVRHAWTLPGRFYTDQTVYERSKEAVFARSWQIVAHLNELKAPGQLLPVTLLEGCLDEPLVLTRGQDDRLNALSNVCTHRGNLVCEGATNANSMRCRYHGRRFSLEGKCTSMPEFEEVVGYPAPSDDLPVVPHGLWRSFAFVSLMPENPLSDVFAEVEERVGWLPVEQFRPALERGRDYLVHGHWGLYVDNYLEGFHIPYIHAALAGTLDYSQYETILLKHGNLQLGVAGDGEECFDLPRNSPDFGRRIGAYYYWLYPNLMLNFYPWGLSVNIVRPLGPSTTKVSFMPYVWDDSKIASGAGGALDRVEREDEAVVEMVQKGLRSRLYDRGRFSVKREAGVHQFHRMLAAALN